MKDFAIKLPRLASLALAFAEATGDVTEPAKALVDAAMVDIPALGWDAPFTLLSLVERLRTAREAAGAAELHIDANGNGPWCKHGGIPEICSTCGLPGDIERQLRTKLVELASKTKPTGYRIGLSSGNSIVIHGPDAPGLSRAGIQGRRFELVLREVR